VVVVVNDGEDDTWQAAQELAAPLRSHSCRCDVIRSEPGRAAALNAAEDLIGTVPRLYLDQDAAVSRGAVAALAAHLAPGTGYHFAALQLRLSDTTNRVSRAYFRGWSQLPYVRASPVTIGAYAVSAQGRARWGAFPPLQSDDKFVRMNFLLRERVVVGQEWYSVLPPEGLAELVRARRRYSQGNRELLELGYSDDAARHAGIARAVLDRPLEWPSFAMVGAVHGLAAIRLPVDRNRRASR
jgi:glycosyltransferase involved in cell wall biosynthesis